MSGTSSVSSSGASNTSSSSASKTSESKSVSESKSAGESKLSSSDRADVSRAVSEVDAKSVATETANLAGIDGDQFEASSTREVKSAKADSPTPVEGPAAATENIDQVHDELAARAEEGKWRSDPAEARDLVSDLTAAADTLPEDQRDGFLHSAGSDLIDYATTPAFTVDAQSAEIIGEITPMLQGSEAQAAIDNLSRALNSEDRAASTAAYDALTNNALAHSDADVQSNAAKAALMGPKENIESAIRGERPGQSAETVAELARTANNWEHRERALNIADELGGDAAARFAEAGIVHTEKPATGPLLSDGMHLTLDGLGMIPLVGEPIDLFHAGVYALEGDGINAGMSLGALLPAAGQAIAGGRIAAKGADNLLRQGDELAGLSPALRDSPYHPDVVSGRVKPRYEANPAHDPKSPLFNPNKDPEPPDAAGLFVDAERAGFGTWYVRGEQGWYRYFSDNAGPAHFSGIIPESDVLKTIPRHISSGG